ncbi:hypothetical protein V6N11_002082 [Hibiscus sabdariffa]|uniref:Uncharacterized protein n=1 Tax=Hibiscus sabdariffa TaxID=183260 RepID=A0ABR2QUC1_9ROSI
MLQTVARDDRGMASSKHGMVFKHVVDNDYWGDDGSWLDDNDDATSGSTMVVEGLVAIFDNMVAAGGLVKAL